MNFVSRHVANKPNQWGFVNYSEEDNKTWSILFDRQIALLPGKACDEHIQGICDLGITRNKIPQLPEINHRLYNLTGWQVIPVQSMISAHSFFKLLASRVFPVATFIRFSNELDYAKEPDIFHELFGHCPMLTNQIYANIMHDFACKTINMPRSSLPFMQKIFMFTAEFGLINTENGLRAYGAGILSSPYELVHSVENHLDRLIKFDIKRVLSTPYHIDKVQDTYFVIRDYNQLLCTLGSAVFDFKRQKNHASSGLLISQ